jgi:hypothetical protein
MGADGGGAHSWGVLLLSRQLGQKRPWAYSSPSSGCLSLNSTKSSQTRKLAIATGPRLPHRDPAYGLVRLNPLSTPYYSISGNEDATVQTNANQTPCTP